MKLDFGLSASNLDGKAKESWPFEFGLIYSVTLGREGLTTSIMVRNEGDVAWEFQVLMHSYLRVKVRLSIPTTTARQISRYLKIDDLTSRVAGYLPGLNNGS